MNDRLRATGLGGSMLVTMDVAMFGRATVRKILAMVRSYCDWNDKPGDEDHSWGKILLPTKRILDRTRVLRDCEEFVWYITAEDCPVSEITGSFRDLSRTLHICTADEYLLDQIRYLGFDDDDPYGGAVLRGR